MLRLWTAIAIVCYVLGNSPAIKEEDAEGDVDYDEYEPEKKADDELFFPLEHSLGDTFSPRGNLVVSISQLSSEATVEVRENYKFSGKETKAFKELMKKKSFYRIRVRSDPKDESSPYVMASLQACQLVHSHFEEVFTLHLDKKGRLSGLDFRPFGGVRECLDGADLPDDIDLKSTASALLPNEATKIPLPKAVPIQPPPGMKNVLGAEGDKPEQQQSFLRRYWYIILPVVLLLMSGGEDPDAGKGGGGGKPAAGKK